jgi:hypothetical protein
VIAHRIAYTPSHLATIQELGHDEALRYLWQCCLAQAPRPRVR